MPDIVKILIALFFGLILLVAITKRFPVHLTEKQSRVLMYVAMGALVVTLVAGLFRTM